MGMKNFLNYFEWKIILLNIFQNVEIYFFKYFVLHITLILRNGTILYYSASKIFFSCIILQNVFLAPEQVK